MKIKKHAVVSTAFLHLKDADEVFLYEGKEKVGIELFSPGTPEAAKVEERVTGRLLKEMNDAGGKAALPSLDQQRADAAQDLADVTAAFHHIEYDGPDGKPLTGRALYVAVYSDPELGYIKKQVSKFQADWGKFKAGSLTA